MTSLREAQKRMTRELLLDSGLTLFAEKGYQATTIEDIAGSAGTTRTTFYLHFATKSTLLLELLRRVSEEVVAADRQPLEECVASGEASRLRGWLDHNFDNWPKLRPYLLPAYEAAPTDPEVHQALITWFEDTIAAMHRGLDRAGRYDPADRRPRCVLAFGQFEYLAHRYFSLGWRTPRADVLRNITDSWAYLLTDAGVGGPERAAALG